MFNFFLEVSDKFFNHYSSIHFLPGNPKNVGKLNTPFSIIIYKQNNISLVINNDFPLIQTVT